MPELFFAEILNVLSRITKDKEKALETLQILEQLGLERIGQGYELLALATEMAIDWKVSGYDAIYIATAKLTKGKWLTFDQETAKKVKEKNLVQLLE